MHRETLALFRKQVRVWLKGRAPDLGSGGLGSIPSTLSGGAMVKWLSHFICTEGFKVRFLVAPWEGSLV